MAVLGKIVWAFNNKNPETISDFNKRVSQYQIRILKERACWKPDEIIVEHPAIDIVFMAWITENSLAANETLLEEDGFFEDVDNSDNDLFQADIQARLNADNGENFTALELLYKLDQQMKAKEIGDHIFFEGLSENATEDKTPRFYLMCGS